MNFLEYNPKIIYNFWIIFQKIDLFGVSDEAGHEVVFEGLGDTDGVELADV